MALTTRSDWHIHSVYANGHEVSAPYLEKAGFADGEIGGIREEDLWIR